MSTQVSPYTINIARCGSGPQRGAALVIALILLLVITLVGLASIGSTIMQNKAASNQYDRQIAFQSSEAAIREAEATIISATATQPAPAGFANCSDGSGNTCLADPFEDTNVTAAQIVTVSTNAFNAGALAAQKPQYVIQYLGPGRAPTATVRRISNATNYNGRVSDATADYYRITVRSGDPATLGNRSIVTLQSTFRD